MSLPAVICPLFRVYLFIPVSSSWTSIKRLGNIIQNKHSLKLLPPISSLLYSTSTYRSIAHCNHTDPVVWLVCSWWSSALFQGRGSLLAVGATHGFKTISPLFQSSWHVARKWHLREVLCLKECATYNFLSVPILCFPFLRWDCH